ncbi:MAG: hypothetical protein ACP5KZ_07020, partial [bacterium]
MRAKAKQSLFYCLAMRRSLRSRDCFGFPYGKPRFARHPFKEGEWFSEYPAPYGAPLFPKGEFGAEYPAFLLFYSPFIERG